MGLLAPPGRRGTGSRAVDSLRGGRGSRAGVERAAASGRTRRSWFLVFPFAVRRRKTLQARADVLEAAACPEHVETRVPNRKTPQSSEPVSAASRRRGGICIAAGLQQPGARLCGHETEEGAGILRGWRGAGAGRAAEAEAGAEAVGASRTDAPWADVAQACRCRSCGALSSEPLDVYLLANK